MTLDAIPTKQETPPPTVVKLATAKCPRYVKLGDHVHGHRRKHGGEYFMHYHQHHGGNRAHDHPSEYWDLQMTCYEKQMSFIVLG